MSDLCKNEKPLLDTELIIKEEDPHNQLPIDAFQCQFCENTFRSKTRVQIHECVHTGEKPYKCKFCNKSFKQKYTFKSKAFQDVLSDTLLNIALSRSYWWKFI